MKKGHEHYLKNGLICHKGGNLAQKIFESGQHSIVVNIESLFTNPGFKDKFMLYAAS